MKVLITGAAGSVGHQALLAFSAAGHDVVCTDIVEDKNVSFKFIKGNLTDPFFVANLLKDEKPDIVVNCAAIVDIGKSYKDLRRVNFDAVATLFDRCCFMGVARLIHISTGSLYKPGNVPHVENEEIKFGNDYEKSKFDAEKYLLKAYNENILKDRFVSKVSILRPTLIYGPRSRVLFSSMACIPEILKSFRIKKVPQLIGGPKTNLVHCEDVARICLHLAEDDFGSRGFEIYNASDLDPMPFFEFMNPINEIGGLELTDTKVGPYKFFKIIAPAIQNNFVFGAFNKLTELLWHITNHTHGALSPRMDKEMLAFLIGDSMFSSKKLIDTGFKFKYPTFEEGWKNAYEWYKNNGWLK